ncbi:MULTISPECIES: Rha family phage regulatory protein [Pantoea]|uniref:Peptidase n=1 Tax=Candidatus Pantoea gossypiicola TaxID=2608008 RepID=A0AB34CNR8_9GAMM|nr:MULTISPECIES: Rha family phage regulatory protein [Pantoea]KAA5961037.1 peptidase [Pantoea sp. VH_24]KAA5964422.1 peptidase [Pantoea sp. VH_16]KAA5968640.1 peptidase [Pantoea sp. VH_18]KAA6004293.1 peptidase [Pantoea sp. M_1]KAA6006777.1 peptidase [Pantoea sp. F_7]
MITTLLSIDNSSSGRYSPVAAAKSAAGLRIPELSTAHNHALSGFFMRAAFVHLSMVAQAGASLEAPVSVEAGNANSVWATTNHGFASVGGSNNHSTEAAIMATIPAIAQPKITVTNGQAVTTSFAIAEYFHKRHADVLRKIESLECSEKFMSTHFCVHTENIRAGAVSRDSKYYRITRDGFAFLAMGFTGKRAAQFKEAYINAFNQMEAALTQPALPDLRSASHNAEVVAEYLNIIHRAWCKKLYPMLVAADSPLARMLNDRISDAATLASFVKSDIDRVGRH